MSAAGLVALFIAIGGFFYGFKTNTDTTDRIQHETEVRAYDGCKSGNEARKAIRDTFQLLIDVSVANPDPNRTAEEIQRSKETIAQFTRGLDAKLGSRDCGPVPQ